MTRDTFSHSDGSADKGREAQKPPPLHAEAGVPARLVYAGIAVGLLMIFAGMGLLWFNRPSLQASLMTCVGLGLVLVCFGTKAGGTWSGWSATGAGAMAVLLFALLEYYTPRSFLDSVKKGQLRGDFSKVADIRIIDENPLYEYRDMTTESERFIFLDETLHGKRMRVQVDTTEKGPGKESFELIGDADKIAANYLGESSAPRSLVQWDFDYEHRKITDGGTVVFAVPAKFDGDESPKVQSRYDFPQLIATANAQSEDSNATSSAPKKNDVPTTNVKVDSSTIATFVDELRSDDPTVRRNGRDFLVATGSEAIPPLMSALRASTSDYRLRGGAAYVLSTTLIRNPEEKKEISSKLFDNDFPVLVSLASDEDKTIRYQATEFLYDLGDPRSIPYSVGAARVTSDPNRAVNQILILGKSSQDLSISDRNNIVHDLTHGPGMNNSIVGNEGYVKKWLGVGH